MTTRLFDRRALLTHPFVDVVLYEFAYSRVDGSWSDRLKRIVIDRGEAVAVLLHLKAPDGGDQLLFVRQFRYPTYNPNEPDDPDNGWMVELVAGIIDPGERAMMSAHRELTEETGLRAEALEFISDFYLSPGGSNEKTHLFYGCAKVDPADLDLEKSHGLEDEDIQLVLMSPRDFLQQVEDNRIHDAKTIIAAEWLRRNLDKFGGA